MRLTRREALAAAGAVVAIPAAPALGAAAAPSLNGVAKLSGRRFGSAVAWSPAGTDAGSFTNPLYAAILERDCSLLVPENQLKWQWVRRSPGTFDFRAFDAIADYAASHGFQLRGHTLFWTPTILYP
jgi:endo-1,4-beta-xylanase